jgi:hypothetical protein
VASGSVTPTPTPATKPGWKSTEFWMTLTSQLLNVLALTNVLPTGDQSMVSGWIGKIIFGIVAAYSLGHYIKGRATVKANQ